jgi:hypothetical protein
MISSVIADLFCFPALVCESFEEGEPLLRSQQNSLE